MTSPEDPQARFEGEPAPGSRDTGADVPSAGEDRPSGTYEGDESVPDHGSEADFDTRFTNEPPRDAESAVPPYEGRKTEGSPGTRGADIGGGTASTGTASPADEQPASQGSQSGSSDDGVGPTHVPGTGRAEDKS
jgi:hypothetical protein